MAQPRHHCSHLQTETDLYWIKNMFLVSYIMQQHILHMNALSAMHIWGGHGFCIGQPSLACRQAIDLTTLMCQAFDTVLAWLEHPGTFVDPKFMSLTGPASHRFGSCIWSSVTMRSGLWTDADMPAHVCRYSADHCWCFLHQRQSADQSRGRDSFCSLQECLSTAGFATPARFLLAVRPRFKICLPFLAKRWQFRILT